MTGDTQSPASTVPRRSAPQSGVPDQRTLLTGVIGFRLLLALLLLGRSALLWRDQPETGFAVAVATFFVLAITAYGAYTMLRRSQPPLTAALFLQALLDLGLVTALVYLGGTSTVFAAAYIVVIAGYAVLLPVVGGVAVLLLASASYLSAALIRHPDALPPGLTAQLIVFTVVFALVAALGHRLRHTAAHQTRLESELQQARFEAAEILSSIRAGVLTVDGKGRLVFLNPPAQRLLGLEAAGAGEPVLPLLAARAPELHQALVAGIESGVRIGRGEGTVTVAGAEPFPIGLSTATFQRDGGAERAVTAVFTDLSELKQLQELQFRAERLEAVAALSASLAHEIRNPLASIRSSVEQLARSADADDDERLLGRLIVRESDRLSRLLQEFLDFSRVRAANFAAIDLCEVARDAIHVVEEHPECGEGVRVRLEGRSTTVSADEDLVHRIVSNLVLNAVQACRGQGNVTVTVEPAADRELPPGANLASPVRLVVEDDGPGIDPELRDRLFQPFVSGRAGGSGLGLAIVQRAVEAHRGLVLVDSQPGQGARFTIYLPSRLFVEGNA